MKKGENSFYVKLWSRLNSELGVLGFVAFMVWLLSRTGTLKQIVSGTKPSDLGPYQEADLLHTIEDVHMRLFMSLLLYFIIMTVIVATAERYMRGWAFAQENIHLRSSQSNTHVSQKVASEFVAVWSKFQLYLMANRPLLDEVNDNVHVPIQAVERFNLAAYFIRSFEEILIELVHVKVYTWAGTAAIALIIGLTSGFSPASENNELVKVVVFQVVIFAVILIMYAFVAFLYSHTVARDDSWIKAKWILALGRFSIEVVMTRILQIGLFYCCYTFVFLCSAPTMNNKMKKNLIVSLPAFLLGYVVTFVAVMFWVVPFLLPKFNVVFRCPPFLDQHELETIVKVIHLHYHTDFFPRLHPKTQFSHPSSSDASHTGSRAQVSVSRSLCHKLLLCLEVESSVSYSASTFSHSDDERHELIRIAQAELRAAAATASRLHSQAGQDRFLSGSDIMSAEEGGAGIGALSSSSSSSSSSLGTV